MTHLPIYKSTTNTDTLHTTSIRPQNQLHLLSNAPGQSQDTANEPKITSIGQKQTANHSLPPLTLTIPSPIVPFPDQKPIWIHEELEKERSFFRNTSNKHRGYLEKASGIPFPLSSQGYKRSRPGIGIGMRTQSPGRTLQRDLNAETTPASTTSCVSPSRSISNSSSASSFTPVTSDSDSTPVTTPGTDMDVDTPRTAPELSGQDTSKEMETGKDKRKDMNISSLDLDEVDYALWAIAQRSASALSTRTDAGAGAQLGMETQRRMPELLAQEESRRSISPKKETKDRGKMETNVFNPEVDELDYALWCISERQQEKEKDGSWDWDLL
ncbi:hypothetical protein BJY04DRAFT_187051 [Aspergillus karnatakaensis]|uniref:uncharacterized protein n=1 Tax=Aspergillus karnatakaensis TaxID=1810916 RepID=UPI003CCD2807